MTKLLLAAVSALSLAASVAHADTRAWTAAKKVLPAGLQGIVGANVSALRSTELFKTLWSTLLAKNAAAADGMAKVKDVCKLDLPDVIDSMAVGMDAAEHTSIIVALRGKTRTDAEACLQKLAQGSGKALAISADGPLTKYDAGNGGIYLRWLDKTTFVFTNAPDDEALLSTLTTGGIGKDKVIAAGLAGVKANAALTVIVNKPQDLNVANAKMSIVYASAMYAKANITVDLHVVVDSPASATAAAAAISDQVAQAAKGGMPVPQLDNVVKTVAIKSAGSEILATASISEDDALAMVKLLIATM